MSSYIIWIDPNIGNEENTHYLNEFKSYKNWKIISFKEVKNAISYIKNLEYNKMNINKTNPTENRNKIYSSQNNEINELKNMIDQLKNENNKLKQK